MVHTWRPTPGHCPRRDTLDDAAHQVRWRLPLTEAAGWSNCRNQWQFSVYGRHCPNSSEKNGLRLRTPSRPSHIPSVSRRRGWPLTCPRGSSVIDSQKGFLRSRYLKAVVTKIQLVGGEH